MDNPEVTIHGFPMPPSANAAYANALKGRVKTTGYRAYEDEVKWWLLKNSHHINRLRDWVSVLPSKHAIRIDHIFHFLPHKIITKAGLPRKNDTWNRTKVLHDVLASFIGIDDCYFWSGSVEKSPICIEGLPESVDLSFSFVDIRKSKTFAEF